MHSRRAIVGIAVAALVFVASGCGASEQERGALERVRRSGVLRWGGDIQGGEPYVYEDRERPGRLVGFEVDIARAMARELGVRARFVQVDWSNLVPALERGTFDVALNGLEVTRPRVGRVLFTRPYYVFSEWLVVRRGERRIRGLTTVRGRTVGTLGASQAQEMLEPTGAIVRSYEGVDEPYIDLEQGRIDAVLLDDIIAQRYGLFRPSLRLAGDVGQGYYAAAVPRGETSLREALDLALTRITARGELRRILARNGIDNGAQSVLERWTPEDQRRLLREPSQARFGAHALALFFEGAGVTVLVSTASMAIAIVLGLLFAVVRLYGPRWAGALVTAYVEIFRGTPVLLQLYVIYFGLAPWVRFDAMTAAILGLGLNYAAYEAEVYRAGVQAVPVGQLEAALTLGMSMPLALRRVVLPQALRIALPAVTNDFIALLKDSSLVSVITVVELTKRMTITAVDTRDWLYPGIACAALYFAMSYPLSLLSRRLERKLERA